jgi:hypothetical protein
MRTMLRVWVVAIIGCGIGALLQEFEVIQAPAYWALYGAIWGALALAAAKPA